MIGWIGSAFLLAGSFGVGNKWRPSFLLSFAGESIWCYLAWQRNEPDLLAVCLVFNVMFLINFYKWRPRAA